MVALLPAAFHARAAGSTATVTSVQVEDTHAHIPGSITLASMIEVQKAARLRRLKSTATAQGASPYPAPTAGTWTAQLGAFGSQLAAEQHLHEAQETLSVPAALEVRASGALYRLQSTATARDDAEGLCARLQASGFDCFIRPADLG